MTNATPAHAALAAADEEPESLQRDADRYRVLREHWLQVEGQTTVMRALGLDLWCDEQRAAPSSSPASGEKRLMAPSVKHR